MEAVIYTRVSSDQNQGRSVSDQEKECRAECARKGWPVRRVFTDNDIGASRFSKKYRTAWAELKAELRPGDILVCWEASRAHRGLEDYLELRDLCAGLNVPVSYSGRELDLTIGDDRFVGGLDALLAEREAEKIRERVLRGRRASVADRRPGTRPPWGYRIVRPTVWEPDPDRAMMVRVMVSRLLDGESQRQVFKWLQDTGDSPWCNASAFRRGISNPAYAGLYVHHGEVVGKGTWEPLITEQQHRQLVARFTRLKLVRGQESGPGPRYLLSGIALCGVCKEPLRHKIYKHRRNGYVCNEGHVSRVAEELDAIVERALFARLAEVNPADYATDDPAVVATMEEIATIEADLEKWTTAAIAGEVTAAAFARIEQGLLARAAALRERDVPRLRVKLPAGRLEANWKHMDMRQRRAIVRGLMTVTVPRLGGYARALPGDVVITRL